MLSPNRHFSLSAKMNGTQTGKSMKNALYVLQYAKGTCWAEAMSSSENIKPVALAVIELHLSEGISQVT